MRPPSRAIALVTALAGAGATATASAAPPEPAATWVEPNRAPPQPSPETPASPGVAPENYRMVLAGNIVTGLGLGGFIAMTTGFLVASDARDRLGFATARGDDEEISKQQRRVRSGNIVGITGAAAMGALLITGLTLIGVGRARERKRRAALENARLLPYAAPGLAGVQWNLRF